MTEIKEVKCPGCGKEMRRHRYDCGWGARIAWYECEICGWRAPMCADDNRAYEVAMRRCDDHDTTAVNAVPVRHGKWIWNQHACGYYMNGYVCSLCKQGDWHDANYCPNCGAKMDGVEK